MGVLGRRPLLILFTVMFAVFELAAFVIKRLGGDADMVTAMGLGIAVVYLMAAVLLVVREWRAGGGPTGAAARFLRGHADVERAVGGRPRIGRLRELPDGRVTAVVHGPSGRGDADVSVVKRDGRWTATAGAFRLDGVRLPLF